MAILHNEINGRKGCQNMCKKLKKRNNFFYNSGHILFICTVVHFGNHSGTVCHVKILDWSHKPLEETRKGVSWLINEACTAFETPLKF